MVDASSVELFLESLKSASTISRELLGLKKGGAANGSRRILAIRSLRNT